MILLVGATGLLGSTIAHQLRSQNLPVRCFVRHGSDTSSLPPDVNIKRGDVTSKADVSAAMENISAVISSFATNIAKDPRVYTLWSNDYEGNRTLIECARSAGVRKFIFTSYWGLAKAGGFEHGKIKKIIEDMLSVSAMDYTVFRITTLATDMSMLTGTSLQKRGWTFMLMKKNEKIRPILLEDLSRCIVDALDNSRASFKVIEVAGTEEYTLIELRDLFRTALGRRVHFIFVPLTLASAIASCIDCFTGSAYNARGLVSAFTGGSTCDITEMNRIFTPAQGSFSQYLKNFFSTGSVARHEPD